MNGYDEMHRAEGKLGAMKVLVVIAHRALIRAGMSDANASTKILASVRQAIDQERTGQQRSAMAARRRSQRQRGEA